jgi:hypothetical protein
VLPRGYVADALPVVAVVVTSVEELAVAACRCGGDSAYSDDDRDHSGDHCPPMSAEGRPRVVLIRDGVVPPRRGLAMRSSDVPSGASADADRKHDVLLVEMELLMPFTIRVRGAEVIRRNTYLWLPDGLAVRRGHWPLRASTTWP